jgi:Fur family ferric uptake transcriptional regulator
MKRPAIKHELVLEALSQAAGPMSANELWESLRAENSRIGLATVYRALRRGVDEDQLVAVELQSGSIRYEPANLDHHHHFLCSSCERAFDLEGCVRHLDRLTPKGFQVERHEILLFGECADCRRAG